MQPLDDKGFMTLQELQHHFHEQLDELYGKEEVSSFFRMLAHHYLKLKPVEIVLNPNNLISDYDHDLFLDAIKRLKVEEPIQYIIGETEFFGLPFKVSPDTLIPRPETEELVQWIIEEQQTAKNRQPTVLDIGTGSGCIAIALAKSLTEAKVYALEVSNNALKVAKENARLNNLDVEFIEGDILADCHTELVSASHQFDIIVSNPPYVREVEKSTIKNNVLNYEPHLALFVKNDDSLQFYRAICEFAVHNLKPDGMLFFEINQYLGRETKQLLNVFNFKAVELRKDLSGNDRMIKAIKP